MTTWGWIAWALIFVATQIGIAFPFRRMSRQWEREDRIREGQRLDLRAWSKRTTDARNRPLTKPAGRTLGRGSNASDAPQAWRQRRACRSDAWSAAASASWRRVRWTSWTTVRGRR